MPAPANFTMEDVVNGVLIQLRFAPGRDVQIHLQDGIRQDASILYRTLMQKYIWRDFISMTPFTTNASGAPVQSLAGVLTRFSDIAQIFRANDEQELPFAPALSNPSRYRVPTIISVGQPQIFAIYPVNKPDSFILWSRATNDVDFELSDPVPFYKDVLVLGTAYQLCLKAGINMELTQSLKQQFDQLVQTYRINEIPTQYNTRPVALGNPMTDWYVTDSTP
jgi:hypothetical protein